ncbi:neutral/alkaline non-lysosomal ceramidase N-terminal domain-containing protein [Sinimarinibacterium thermocellulolyticum]|uniref:Neutral/alkaline non-lysosomal ceramidase N-terminal domain-containing protein n=1 Tax=Sinimarinibacterium thermocellulolyticum TaxID=3170016 RepID=A0ABV2A8I2_9GAMM
MSGVGPFLRRALPAAVLMLAACGGSQPTSGGSSPTPPPASGEIKVRVGVGITDMTPEVGYCAGQYCDFATDTLGGLIDGDLDPFLTHKLKHASYGVQSRLTARAIVVEGANGKRIALLKTDNYLAQDMLQRRVAQLLEDGDSGIGHAQILHHVTHNHSSAYASTLAAGVWLFQDVFDARFFEHQARQMAAAIEQAAANLKPARMAAMQIQHRIYKGNVVRLATAIDGTPAGYPLEYGDRGLVVIRFDDLSDPEQPRPLAAWVNWGEHPESLDPHDLHSADFLAALERFVDRELGAPLVFSQGDVGSAENSGDRAEILADDGSVCGRWPSEAEAPEADTCADGEGTIRDWNHRGYVQTERNVRYLADDILRAWDLAGTAQATVPFSSDFTVDWRSAWVPGPLSHPLPTVSNCNTELSFGGDVGVPVLGLPDCSRNGVPGENPLTGISATIYATLKAEGVPVPDHYSAPSVGLVEENARIHLQAMRLGDILLASCACEPQADLILNLESRANDITGDIYAGFDWACLIGEFRDDPRYAEACAIQARYFDPLDPENNAGEIPGDNFAPEAIARMRAQVHNDARGWDAPENVLRAQSEPADATQIWGNFTREEIQDLGVPGYRLVVGVGHAGDYNGYTVSYREYMNRDHYRKALTAYGPHTADYMVTRLVRMGAALKGGPELAPEPLDVLATVDALRQETLARTVGAASAVAYDTWQAGLPNDAGEPEPLQQPADITRFTMAQFVWRGGSTAVDNPRVVVQRETAPGQWTDHADQSGEVITRVEFPDGVPGVLRTYAGMQEWIWTAGFEAYSAHPARLGSTPPGRYRFCVEGRTRQAFATKNYAFCSEPFTVSVWDGIGIENLSVADDAITFDVAPIVYPRTPGETAFPFIADNGSARICDTCSFRPWARQGVFDRAVVELVGDAGGGGVDGVRELPASCDAQGRSCRVEVTLAPGDRATVRVFDRDGNSGSMVAR